MKMGVEELTFMNQKNSYTMNGEIPEYGEVEQAAKVDNEIEEQPDTIDSKEIDAKLSPSIMEEFYKGNRTSPKGKGKSKIFLRGWKSIGKMMGFSKTEKFIDEVTEESKISEKNTQSIDSKNSQEMNELQKKEIAKRASVTKEVTNIDKDDVFEEESVQKTAEKVIKEQAKTATQINECIEVHDEDNNEGIEEKFNQESNTENKTDCLKVKPDIKDNVIVEEIEKKEIIKKDNQHVIEKDECKDIEKQVEEKNLETTVLISLVNNINSTKTYLESDESKNSLGDSNESTTLDTDFFKLINSLTIDSNTKVTSDSKEKSQTFLSSTEKVTRSQINTVNDIFKKTETAKSFQTEDNLRERVSKTGQYRDHADRKDSKNAKSDDQKKDAKKEKQPKVESSSAVDRLADSVCSLEISTKEKADRKKTKGKKSVKYLERGAETGRTERRQKHVAKVAPYTSRPTVSVNLGNLSGGHCVPGRESTNDSIPITIHNDEHYYSNTVHPPVMVDGLSFVQYDAPFVQQSIAPLIQQDITSLPLLERETSWEEIELTDQDRAFLLLLDDNVSTVSPLIVPNIGVSTLSECTNSFFGSDDNDAAFAEVLKFATQCSPDISRVEGLNGNFGMDGNEMEREAVPWGSCGGQNSPERIFYLENSPLSKPEGSPKQFNYSPSFDRVGNDWGQSNTISHGQISPEWIYPNRFPENSPMSQQYGSPGSLYSSPITDRGENDWIQRNGDSSSFSSLESPGISGGEDNILNKPGPEIILNPSSHFGVVQPNIQGMISNTIVDSNFGRNPSHLLAPELSVNIDPLIKTTTLDAASSIQAIRSELESLQTNVASSCQRCPDDNKSANDILGEEFASLDPEQQRNILFKVHGFNEENVMKCFDSLLLVCESTKQSDLLQHYMFSVCERILMSASTRGKFFETNEMGQTVLDRAVLNCPQMPILSRYLAECCLKALPNHPSDKDYVIDRSDADRNGLLHRAVSKGESCLPHLAGLLAVNRQHHIFDVNLKNADGYSPLHLALTACSWSVSASGDSPVCRGICLKLAHLLIVHGNADPNIRAPKNGNTPLHIAVDTKACASNLVSLLLRHRAITSNTNYSKLTPLDLAKLVSKSSRTEVSREVVKIMKDFVRRQKNNNKM